MIQSSMNFLILLTSIMMRWMIIRINQIMKHQKSIMKLKNFVNNSQSSWYSHQLMWKKITNKSIFQPLLEKKEFISCKINTKESIVKNNNIFLNNKLIELTILLHYLLKKTWITNSNKCNNKLQWRKISKILM